MHLYAALASESEKSNLKCYKDHERLGWKNLLSLFISHTLHFGRTLTCLCGLQII